MALTIRAYALRVRITFPVRRVIALNDYQDIFANLTQSSSQLQTKKGRLQKRSHWLWLRYIALWPPINTPLLRPPTFNAVRVHLPYAYANLSEVSRRRFRKDPNLLNDLKAIFVHLNDAIFRNDTKQFCHFLSEYYRLMRFQGNGSSPEVLARGTWSEKIHEDLGTIQSAISKSDLFKAYQVLLRWGKEELLAGMNDLELLGISFLTAKLESLVQGTEYLVLAQDVQDTLDDLLYRAKAISHALKKGHSTLLLDAIG